MNGTVEGFCFVLDAFKDLCDNNCKSIKPEEDMSEEQNETTGIHGNELELQTPKNRVEYLLFVCNADKNNGSKFQMRYVLSPSYKTHWSHAVVPDFTWYISRQS